MQLAHEFLCFRKLVNSLLGCCNNSAEVVTGEIKLTSTVPGQHITRRTLIILGLLKDDFLFNSDKIDLRSLRKSQWHRTLLEELGRSCLEQFEMNWNASASYEVGS